MRARALTSLVVLLLTAVATAQPQPNPEGAKLFEEGRVLAKDGKWEQACDKFAKSLELDPAVGTQLNYADCHEKLDHNAQAWRLFDSAADGEKITNPERAKFSRSRADALLAKLGVVILKITQPDAPMIAVSIGGRTIKPAPVIKEIVDPGEIAIVVTSQYAPTFQRTEKVGAGKTVTIDVPAFAATGAGDGNLGSARDSAPESDSSGRRRSRVILSVAVGGAGAIALITGVVLGAKAKGDYNDQFPTHCTDGPSSMCDDVGFKAQNDAISLANVGTGVGIAGIVLLGAGAALFLTAPHAVAVTPTATASSGGISVVGRF